MHPRGTRTALTHATAATNTMGVTSGALKGVLRLSCGGWYQQCKAPGVTAGSTPQVTASDSLVLSACCAAACCVLVCSTYSKVFASADDRPIQFRRDGLPISAHQVQGKFLMAPKLPSPAELSVSKRLCAKYGTTTSVCIGVPGRKDPRHFSTVYSLVHTAPHRCASQHPSTLRPCICIMCRCVEHWM